MQLSSLLHVKEQILPVRLHPRLYFCLVTLWVPLAHLLQVLIIHRAGGTRLCLTNLNGCWRATHCVLWFIDDTSNTYPCKAFQNPVCFSLSAVCFFFGITLMDNENRCLAFTSVSSQVYSEFCALSNICVASPQRGFFLVFKDVSFMGFFSSTNCCTISLLVCGIFWVGLFPAKAVLEVKP